MKTVLTVEFALGEEKIVADVMNRIAAARQEDTPKCAGDKCTDEPVDEAPEVTDEEPKEEKPKRSRPSRAKKPAPKPEPADDEDEADEDTDDEDQEDETPAKDTKKKKSNREITHDDVRDLMADVIEEDEDTRPKVLKLLKQYGAKSVSALKDEELEAFYEELEALKA